MLVPKKKSAQLAEQLYKLQKAYLKNMLLGEKSQQHQQQFIEHIFKIADQITLNQVIDLQQLTGVVQEQVFKINLAPPLLSVIGEMTQNQHQQLINNHAPLKSVISDQQVEHWIRKILELENVFNYIKTYIEQTPQIRILCAYWIHQNIARFTPEPIHTLSDKTRAKLPPRIQQFIQLQQQKLEEKLEEKTAQLFQQQLLFLFSLEQEEYLALALSLWDNLKQKPISEFASKISPLDTEEIFILAYEFWKDYRHNSGVQDMIRRSIQYFYHTFENESLFYLFESTGLKVSDIQIEAQRFAPSILQRLDQLDLLDQFIDLIIAPFFQQQTTLDQIASFLDNQTE